MNETNRLGALTQRNISARVSCKPIKTYLEGEKLEKSSAAEQIEILLDAIEVLVQAGKLMTSPEIKALQKKLHEVEASTTKA